VLTRPRTTQTSGDPGQLTLGGKAQPGGHDELLEAVEHAEEKGRRAAAALAPTLENLAMLRQQREMGCSVESILECMIVTGGSEKRRAAEDAFHAYQHAVMELRALMIQSLVDESGSRLTDVAQKLGISRQKVAQLYGVARSIHEKSETQSADS
jgi:hypothetical protein